VEISWSIYELLNTDAVPLLIYLLHSSLKDRGDMIISNCVFLSMVYYILSNLNGNRTKF